MILQDNTSIIDNELSCATPPTTYHPSPLTQHTFQQPSQQRHRVRSASSSHAYITTPPSSHSGGIRKKRSITAASRHRSISTSYGDRLHHLALEQSAEADFQALQHQHQASLNWLTPQHSPEPSCFFQQEPVVLEQYQWAAPTPPRSESGIPSVTADFVDECQQPSCSEVDSPQIFAFDQSTVVADMSSSLGFLLPQQYANASYSSEETASFTQPTTSAPVSAPHYGQTVSSSPSLYQSRPVAARRHTSDLPTPGQLPQMYPGDATRRIASPFDSPANSDYSMPQTQTIPSISSMPLGSPMTSPAPAAAVMAPHYGSPSIYDSSQYYGGATPYTSASGPSQMYAPAPSPAYPPITYPGSSSSSSMEAPRSTEQPARANGPQRRPQCFDHGCNGRYFSTFSNLLRHQRERSGTATKSSCPRCGAEFTRTTARNGHMAHDKCTRVRRSSEDGRRDPDTLAV